MQSQGGHINSMSNQNLQSEVNEQLQQLIQQQPIKIQIQQRQLKLDLTVGTWMSLMGKYVTI